MSVIDVLSSSQLPTRLQRDGSGFSPRELGVHRKPPRRACRNLRLLPTSTTESCSNTYHPPVARAFELIHHPTDVHVAVAQGPESVLLRGLPKTQLPAGELLDYPRVYVFEVDVVDSIAGEGGDFDGVASAYHEMSGIQTQAHL